MSCYTIYEFDGKYFFTPSSKFFYEIKIEKPTDLDGINLKGFKRDVFEVSLVRSINKNIPIDIKVKNTFVRFIMDWFDKNNKVLFFLVSNANGKAQKRKIVFEKWFRDLPQNRKTDFDLAFQSVREKNGMSFIGFILRKDYPKYIEFKDRETHIVFDIERNK